MNELLSNKSTYYTGIIMGNRFVGFCDRPVSLLSHNAFLFAFMERVPNKYLSLSICSCKMRTGYIICGARQDGILEDSFHK